MTWNEIYKSAIDKGYGETELRTKDNAREEVRSLLLNMTGRDINNGAFEIPEDIIEDFCNKHNVSFTNTGTLITYSPLKWNDLSEKAKSVIEWVNNPFTEKQEVICLTIGKVFEKDYRKYMTDGYKNTYPFDTGILKIDIDENLFMEVADYVSTDNTLALIINKDTMYFGTVKAMRDFNNECSKEIPDNEIDLEL